MDVDFVGFGGVDYPNYLRDTGRFNVDRYFMVCVGNRFSVNRKRSDRLHHEKREVNHLEQNISGATPSVQQDTKINALSKHIVEECKRQGFKVGEFELLIESLSLVRAR